MRLRRFTGGMLVAVVLSVVGVPVLATSASAAPAHCGAGYACAWGDKDFKTRGDAAGVIKFQGFIGSFDQHWFLSGHKGNDSASSLYNNGRLYDVKWWYDSQISGTEWGRGHSLLTVRGGSYSDLSKVATTVGWNDKISAANFTSYFNYR